MTIETQTYCVRCGAEKGKGPGGCSSWGKFWKKHKYITGKVEVTTVKFPVPSKKYD